MIGKRALQGVVFGLVAAFFFGTHSVIVRYLTQDIGGLAIAVIRLYIAAAALFAILKLKGHPVSLQIKDRVFLITLAGAAANFVFFHMGLEFTTASNAMLLENTAPFFVLVFLFLFLKEKIRRLDLAAALVALAGVFLTVRHDIALGGAGLHGDLLEILAAVTWAVFVIGSSKAATDIAAPLDRIAFLLKVFLCSAVILTPFAFFQPFNVTTEDIGLLALLGVFPTAIAYLLWYEAAARVSTISAALLFNLSIVFTFVNAHLFLGEEFMPSMIAGGLLIVVAITLSKLGPRSNGQAPENRQEE